MRNVSLIELIIILSITGIMMAVTVPQYVAYKEKAASKTYATRCFSGGKPIFQGAIKSWSYSGGRYKFTLPDDARVELRADCAVWEVKPQAAAPPKPAPVPKLPKKAKKKAKK